MRVIAGSYRGRVLRTVKGHEVRPTSDRLRETLFNILAPSISGARFLDLCAGSGAIGIEALSRGASSVVFVDRSRPTCSVIRQNLTALDIGNQASVLCRDAVAAVKYLARQESRFDIVFFDPPYASETHAKVLDLLETECILAEDAILVVEHLAKTPPRSEAGSLRAYRHLKQGESALSFYALASGQPGLG